MELEKLSEILDCLAKAGNLSVILTGPSLEPLSARFGLPGFCVNALNSAKLQRYCVLAHEFGASQAALLKDRYTYLCPHGLLESLIPLVAIGTVKAYAILGQAKCASPPRGLLRLNENRGVSRASCLADLRPSALLEEDKLAMVLYESLPETDFNSFDKFSLLLQKILHNFSATFLACDWENLPDTGGKILSETEDNQRQSPIPNSFFLHSMVNSLANLSILESARRTNALAVMLGEHLKASIQSLAREGSSLEEESANLSRYLSMQKIRYGELLDYDVKLPKELKDCDLPVDSLLPFVEQAIALGLSSGEEKLDLKVEFYADGKNVFCSLKDNSRTDLLVEDGFKNIPFKENSELKLIGDRMENSRKRLAMAFGERYHEETAPFADGLTRCLIRFPKIHKNKNRLTK
jgi:ligand-binding sensor protein